MTFIHPELSTLALRDISYLIAIAEHRGFRRAATACAVSQPALSAQVRKIEQSFGFQIFDRTGRKVMLTTEGKEIIAQCRTIFDELEELGRIVQGVEPPLGAKFRLGVIQSVAQYLMPHLIEPFAKEFPETELVLVEGLRNELLEYVQLGRIDAAVISYPLPSGKFSGAELFQEELILMVSTDNELADQENVRLKELKLDYTYTLGDYDCFTQQVVRAFPRSERKAADAQPYLRTLESLRLMVAASGLYSIVPALMTDYKSPVDHLVRFSRLENGDLTRTIGFAWRHHFRGKSELERLASIFRRTISGQGLPVETRSESWKP